MKRKVIDELIRWHQDHDGRPVLLTGAKGVGKTYLAFDFARSFFEDILYLNFERKPSACALFVKNDLMDTAETLLAYFHVPKEAACEKRVLILDEINFCEKALERLTALQFTGEFPRIIAISSNPVRKEEQNLLHHIPIYPLQFDEFLIATANDWYIEAILTHYESNKNIPEIVHKELLALHELYLNIGGMPGIVNEYLNFNSTINIGEQHSLLLGTYHDYINTGHIEGDALKMNQVLNSLALQLLKANKKFQYKLIRKGTTHAMYKEAIKSLTEHNYALPCYKIPTEQICSLPSIIESDCLTPDSYTNFKLYLPDVGFLSSQIAEDEADTTVPAVKKALYENYVAETLQANGYPLVFWESESMAKVDFILPTDHGQIPVELFCDDNTRSKSISILKQKYDFPYSIKISSKNFDYSNHIKYVPYYAVFCI